MHPLIKQHNSLWQFANGIQLNDLLQRIKKKKTVLPGGLLFSQYCPIYTAGDRTHSVWGVQKWNSRHQCKFQARPHCECHPGYLALFLYHFWANMLNLQPEQIQEMYNIWRKRSNAVPSWMFMIWSIPELLTRHLSCTCHVTNASEG